MKSIIYKGVIDIMLTDLNWLFLGSPWPIEEKDEKERLSRYRKNKLLWENKHNEVFNAEFARIKPIVLNNINPVNYVTNLNYFKLSTLKVVDLILNETPTITSKDLSKQNTINTLIKNSKLVENTRKNIIDYTRFGDGLYKIYKPDLKSAIITTIIPDYWFKVVNPMDINQTTAHVFIVEQIIPGERWYNQERKIITIEIHTVGQIEIQKIEIISGKLMKYVEEPIIISTLLDDFDIIQVSNTQTSDEIYGEDDFNIIEKVIKELEIELSNICKVLDTYTTPTMQGPEGIIKHNKQFGNWDLRIGNFFEVKDGKQKLEYVTFNATLEQNFKTIEILLNQLYILSEVGPVLFGAETENAGIQSGEALRRKLMSPLMKAARIRTCYDYAIKKALSLASQLGGAGITPLTEEDVEIKWKDGLPSSIGELIPVLLQATGGLPIMSQEKAIQLLSDDINSEQIQEEIRKINLKEIN